MSKFFDNQKAFKSEFSSYFTSKLLQQQAIAVGREKAQVEYSTIGSMLKGIVEKVVGNVGSAIPFIGPFVTDLLVSIPIKIYEHSQESKMLSSSKSKSNKIAEIGEALINNVIEETSHEITVIFEYHIAMLQSPNDAAKLAKFSVDKIFKSSAGLADGKRNVTFDRNGLLNILLKEEDTSFLAKLSSSFGGSKLDTIISKPTITKGTSQEKTITWEMVDIFSKVGIRLDDGSGGYIYRINPNLEDSTHIYGFRGPVFEWSKDLNNFVPSRLDEPFSLELPKRVGDKAMEYLPYNRLVHQELVDSYLALLQSPSDIVPFVDYVKARYSLDHDICPVFRGIKIEGTISSANFSGCDMTRMFIGEEVLSEGILCKFDSSRMIGTEITNYNMEGSWFKNADFRWSVLNNVVLRGDTILTNVDFAYTILGEGTDLTDNFSFGTSRTDKTYIVTDKVVSTILRRIQMSETQNEHLTKQVEELLARDAKRESELARLKMREVSVTDEPNFFNVREVVDDFTGRESVLTKISKYFKSNPDKFAVQVLAGMGGMGKTQTVLEYVERNKEKYSSEGCSRVFWVAAETPDSLSFSFREFASKLKLPIEGEDDEKILLRVQDKMPTLPNTLFIFDNVEDISLVGKYLPKSSTHHHVIITTRNVNREDWKANKYDVEILKAFDIEEAHAYIRKTKPSSSESDAIALSKVFENLPLGLSHAMSYIREYGCEISEYLTYYHHSYAEALKCKLGDNSHSSIYVTFSMAIDAIVERFPDAVEIMKVCSYLCADKIPAKIFSGMFRSNMDMLKSLKILQNSGLINVQIEGGERFIYLHRLLQNSILIKVQDAGEDITLLLKASDLVHGSILPSFTTKDMKKMIENNTILSEHAISIISHIKHYKETKGFSAGDDEKLMLSLSTLAMDCGSLHKLLCNYGEAFKMFQEALTIRESILGHQHLDVATSLVQLGETYVTTGASFAKALEIIQEALTIRESILGHEHPDVAECVYYIGVIYSNNSNLTKAFEVAQEALRIYEITLGKCDIYYARSLNEVASFLVREDFDKRDLVKALEMLNDVIKINASYFGDNHLENTYTMNGIALIHKENGNLDKAHEIFADVLKIRESLFGHDNVLVASVLRHIANLYQYRGELEKALELHMEALKIYESILGHENVDVANMLNYIGSVYKDQGDLTKALESYQESLRISKVCLGDDHFSIPSIVENIERVEQTIKEQHMLEFEFDSNSSKKSCCIVASVTKVIYDNPILNCEELMMEANKKGIRAIDILLDLSVDNEVGSQIIEASNEYGAEFVIDTLLGNVSDFYAS